MKKWQKAVAMGAMVLACGATSSCGNRYEEAAAHITKIAQAYPASFERLIRICGRAEMSVEDYFGKELSDLDRTLLSDRLYKTNDGYVRCNAHTLNALENYLLSRKTGNQGR